MNNLNIQDNIIRESYRTEVEPEHLFPFRVKDVYTKMYGVGQYVYEGFYVSNIKWVHKRINNIVYYGFAKWLISNYKDKEYFVKVTKKGTGVSFLIKYNKENPYEIGRYLLKNMEMITEYIICPPDSGGVICHTRQKDWIQDQQDKILLSESNGAELLHEIHFSISNWNVNYSQVYPYKLEGENPFKEDIARRCDKRYREITQSHGIY